MTSIILVEDDPMISEIYQKKFQSAGFEVTVATSGKEVLRIARGGNFDLILLDLVMSEMGGLEVLKELKQSGKYNPLAKVIIFSNLNDKEHQDQAFELGADGFISKTQYNPSDLVKEIQRILGEYQEQEKNSVRLENSGTDSAVSETNQKRILLIEDEDIFIDLFGEKLKADGYVVEVAKNGAWGMKEAMDKDFDLIIMDVIMPSMTGKEILERLKLEEKTKNIPIIVLSASVSDEDLKAMEAMGTVGSFVKTRIVPSDLVKRVKEVIG